MEELKMYQVSTLQALALGYTRSVINVGELKKHGNTGLGTFEAVDGEMIMADGHCYRALNNGDVVEANDDMGVPFSSVCNLIGQRNFELSSIKNIDCLKVELNNRIEMDFGLNSMHMVRIDGKFKIIRARSESPYRSNHVPLKDMLSETQKSFDFSDISGALICVYYPDYMNGINASGWHFHFISDDCTKGGHVFDLILEKGRVLLDKINQIEIQIPKEPMFDTYELNKASEKDIKKVEQGK